MRGVTPNNCTEFFAHISQDDTHYIHNTLIFFLLRKEREKSL